MIDNKPTKQDNNTQQPMGYFIPMQASNPKDEINLLELWKVIWQDRKIIFVSIFIAAVLSIIISLLLPNYYKAEVLLAPVSSDDKSKGLSSTLGSLGGLASLAGISLGSSSSAEENLAILKSREFLWNFIESENMLPILFVSDWDPVKKRWIENDPDELPSPWDTYRLFVEDKLLTTSIDKDSGLVTVAIEWTDPELAAEWANKLVQRLNSYLRTQAIERSQNNLKYLNEELSGSQVEEMRLTLYSLIAEEQRKTMLANTQKEYAFRVVDPAIEPDMKSKPKRSLIVVLSVILGSILAIMLVFVRSAIDSRKKNIGTKRAQQIS